MAKRKILVIAGDRYNSLTIINEVESIKYGKYKTRMVRCLCDCGKETIVRLEYLRSSHTKSCGCASVKELVKHRRTHGYTRTRLYSLWAGMKNRCLNPNIKSFKTYGALGVTICDEWIEFETFCKWAKNNGYSDDLSIERINPFGNYEPNNCTWIPFEEQGKNKRNTIFIEYKSQNKSLSDWAKDLNIKHSTLYNRYYLGWPNERILEQPVRRSLK